MPRRSARRRHRVRRARDSRHLSIAPALAFPWTCENSTLTLRLLRRTDESGSAAVPEPLYLCTYARIWPASLAPKFTGWLAHENPFGFENRRDALQRTGLIGSLTGTPNIPALYGCSSRTGRFSAELRHCFRCAKNRSASRRGSSSLAEQRGWHVNAPRHPARRARHRRSEYAQGKGSVRRVAQARHSG